MLWLQVYQVENADVVERGVQSSIAAFRIR
jgi:hypothetical protein